MHITSLFRHIQETVAVLSRGEICQYAKKHCWGHGWRPLGMRCSMSRGGTSEGLWPMQDPHQDKDTPEELWPAVDPQQCRAGTPLKELQHMKDTRWSRRKWVSSKDWQKKTISQPPAPHVTSLKELGWSIMWWKEGNVRLGRGRNSVWLKLSTGKMEERHLLKHSFNCSYFLFLNTQISD